MIQIVPANLPEDINRCLEIRRQVFIVEQGVSEQLEVDEMDQFLSGCMHFLIVADDKDVGTFRMTVNENKVAKLQKFCVCKEYRGNGYGKYALEFIDGYCEAMEIKKLRLDAQVPVIGFYEKGGYSVVSEEFEEAGILHVKMQKKQFS